MKLSFQAFGEGFPVVLLHGFPLNGSMWNRNAEAITGAGFRVVIPDFPGFGKSGGIITGIKDTAVLLDDLLEDLEIGKAIICGLSMGGYVLLELLKISPQRITAAVLCDTNSDCDSESKQKDRRAMISKINADGNIDTLKNLANTLISHSTSTKNPQLADYIKDMFLAENPDSVCSALEAMATRSDSNELLGRIKCPVKLIFGEDDVMLPAAGKLDWAIANSSLKVIPEAGHFPNLEKPDQFNDVLISFLTENTV